MLESARLVETCNLATKLLVARLIDDHGIEPHIAVVQVGHESASSHYVLLKQKRAAEVGIVVSLYGLEEEERNEYLIPLLDHLAADSDVHGIVLQLPVPGISKDELTEILEHIPHEKDVDGLRGSWVTNPNFPTKTLGGLLDESGPALPPVLSGVLSLLDSYNIPFEGTVAVVGDGLLVGQPIRQYCEHENIPVISVQEDTDQIVQLVQQADIVVTGTGTPNLVTYEWIKPGATVCNVAGDVHESSVAQVAGALTPEKGGIGPLTVTWLLYNGARAALQQLA